MNKNIFYLTAILFVFGCSNQNSEPEAVDAEVGSVLLEYMWCDFGSNTSEESLDKLDVNFSGIILKPNMITPGSVSDKKASSEEIAELTVKCLANNVPKEVPGIAFLSGGQSDEDASNNLSNINKINNNPWKLTFSYGRALQLEAMRKWNGNNQNNLEAQKIIIKRAQMNALAASGKYDSSMENV